MTTSPEGLVLDAGALLSLLRWVSPTLPIGGYAYSRALEYAAHAGWVHDEASAQRWITGMLKHSVAQLDLPILFRLYTAILAGDESQRGYWNDYLSASRESAELALEDAQMGEALLRLLRDTRVVSQLPPLASPPSYVLAFAHACVASSIPVRVAAHGLLWTIGEGQTSVAVRLVPLGQTAGQRVLAALACELPRLVEHAWSLADDELGALTPAQAIASALHETQYTRLFRS